MKIMEICSIDSRENPPAPCKVSATWLKTGDRVTASRRRSCLEVGRKKRRKMKKTITTGTSTINVSGVEYPTATNIAINCPSIMDDARTVRGNWKSITSKSLENLFSIRPVNWVSKNFIGARINCSMKVFKQHRMHSILIMTYLSFRHEKNNTEILT